MATIKGFILDLDGVIVDTAHFHFQAWKKLAEQLEIPFGETENEQLKGVSRRESLHKILQLGKKEVSDEKFQQLMDQKNQWYLEAIEELHSEDTLPGSRTFLEQARKIKIKLALGSASKNAPRILDKLDLKRHFDATIDGTLVSRSKPDPEVFLRGAQELGLEPQECVVFEDSLAGVRAALDGGFKCVGIGKKSALKQAHLVVNDLKQTTPTEVINKMNF